MAWYCRLLKFRHTNRLKFSLLTKLAISSKKPTLLFLHYWSFPVTLLKGNLAERWLDTKSHNAQLVVTVKLNLSNSSHHLQKIKTTTEINWCLRWHSGQTNTVLNIISGTNFCPQGELSQIRAAAYWLRSCSRSFLCHRLCSASALCLVFHYLWLLQPLSAAC